MTKKTKKSLRDRLLVKKTVKPRKVELKDFGETIYMHAVKGKAREAFTNYAVTVKTQDQARAVWIALAAHDEQGNRIFEESDIDSIIELWSPADFMRAGVVAETINGISAALEEQIKNG